MKGIQGTVLVSFIVNTDGTIEEIELVQGIGGGCDEEAIRIIKSSPSWTPGMIKGKAVRTRMKIPISFRLG
jgi:protein TonB